MILYAFIDLPLNATFCRESPRDILEEAYGPGVLQGVQRLAARVIWRSGGKVMSVGRFRSNGGTHRVHFEQKTSGEDLDRAIAFRRPKSAKIDI